MTHGMIGTNGRGRQRFLLPREDGKGQKGQDGGRTSHKRPTLVRLTERVIVKPNAVLYLTGLQRCVSPVVDPIRFFSEHISLTLRLENRG